MTDPVVVGIVSVVGAVQFAQIIDYLVGKMDMVENKPSIFFQVIEPRL